MKLDAPNSNIQKIKFVLLAATPVTNPPAGSMFIYLKEDGLLYTLDSSGTEAEVGAGGAAVANPPTYIHLPVYNPDANTNWSSLINTSIGQAYMISDGAVNAEISWTFFTDSGTYDICFMTVGDNNRGKYHLFVDASETGTPIDGYGSLVFSVGTFSGVALTEGSHTIGFKMSDKSASSSAYYGVLFSVWLKRTGA